MKLNYDYDYDFGSTTHLEITILNEYQIKSETDILLLSRNEPLKILCDRCKKEPATVLYLPWDDVETVLCDNCKEYHAQDCDEFEEYREANIVNSPRVGVCGYPGGVIDVERDGVWKK